MGVDICRYRAAIGTFYAITHKLLNLPKCSINLRFHAYCALVAFSLLFTTRCFIKNDDFAFYRIILLFICMDVVMFLKAGFINKTLVLFYESILHSLKLQYLIMNISTRSHIIRLSISLMNTKLRPASSYWLQAYSDILL